MAGDVVSVPYNRELKPLEDLLSGVRRPGDFFAHGALDVPMPRVEVTGVGVLSFPIPEAQIRQMLARATRAPYGRGEDTLHDEAVRRTWQLPPDDVRIGGKSWKASFQEVLARVGAGLGCEGMGVTAELYKLLVYDVGGFFTAHRDTEKAEGMFGTLVVVLPSAHRGGELIIRHAGREVTVDMRPEEVSELRFAGFYADCEHEVRSITEGQRVCLVYNLVQRRAAGAGGPLTAPLYDSESAAAAAMLEDAFAAAGGPAKLAWLLGHQYSPAGLSFTGLKGEDAAVAKVVRAAAERARCAVHLGIVHIEESGPAQPDYEHRHRDGRGRSWGRYHEEELEEDAGSDSFEVIEVSDASQFIDQWVDTEDRRVAFGRLPLADGEVLPADALDDEEPDEQRLMEATGNEGATFERSYHRAALVIWPRERFADVLLQAGVGAVLPHLRDRVRSCLEPSAPPAERAAVIATARRVAAAWEDHPGFPTARERGAPPDRGEMIRLLGQLGDEAVLARFVEGVVTRRYDGSENASLAGHLRLLAPRTAGRALAGLVRENLQLFPSACVNLLHRLTCADARAAAGSRDACLEMATAIVTALAQLEPPARDAGGGDWWRAQQATPPDATMVADLLATLAALDAPRLRAAACDAMIAKEVLFDPPSVIVPALETLRVRGGDGTAADPEFRRLWRHAAEGLLRRSEHPPAAPTDWRQAVRLACACEDCRALAAFARDAQACVARFRVRLDRRRHLHQQIERHHLDMTHVTERRGSPQTLVCTKTRRTFEEQCRQHRTDRARIGTLLDVLPAGTGETGAGGTGTGGTAELAGRLAAAKARRLRP